MREQLAILKEAQKLDEKLRSLEREKTSLQNDARQAAHRLDDLRKSGEAADQDTRAKRMQTDRLELDLGGHEDKVKKLTVQLNTVKTNKEYAALQHEIAAHKADASLIEDQLLALLDEMDQADEARTRHEEQLAAEQKRQQEVEQRVAQETAAIDQKTARLARERDEKTYRIDAELRQLYGGLLAKRDGRAMVRATLLDDDTRSCSGCFMRLTSNTTSQLMGGESLVRCHSCGRILYIDDDEKSDETS